MLWFFVCLLESFVWRQNEKSPCYGYLASQREMPASRGHHFWSVGTFSLPPSLLGPLFPVQGRWKALLEGGGRAQEGSHPPGLVRSMVGLCSSSPHLAPGTAAEGAAGVPGARDVPPAHPHLPGSARWPRPPLASPVSCSNKSTSPSQPYIKRAGPKINLALLFVVDNTEGILCVGRERLFVWVRRQRRSVLADI